MVFLPLDIEVEIEVEDQLIAKEIEHQGDDKQRKP